MDMQTSLEDLAKSRGVVIETESKPRGKVAYTATITLDGVGLKFDGDNLDDVVEDAFTYLDCHESEGVFGIDWDADKGQYAVTLKGTGEVFYDDTPRKALDDAQAVHAENVKKDEEAEKAREKPKRTRKPKDNGATDEKGRLRPTQEEADLATQLDEKDWDKPKFEPAQPPERSARELQIAALQSIATGIMQFADALAKED